MIANALESEAKTESNYKQFQRFLKSFRWRESGFEELNSKRKESSRYWVIRWVAVVKGVEIDCITYYSDILRPFINATDPDDPRLGQRFLFRRDPRNIREIYFFHPEFKQYYAIPYRNTAHPPISIWELRAIQRRLKDQGRKEVDEDLIFRTYEEMRSDEELANRQTKKVRRENQKRSYYSQIQHPTKPNSTSEQTNTKLQKYNEFIFAADKRR
ncbi:hypothetical protein BH20ACI4_BH20ACI4_32090 [soil metagenome]